jgi:hypothetical protein
MPATGTAAEKGQRGGILLRDVHCFMAGDWQGERYDVSDLDEIVDNFRRFSAGPRPLLEVPFVIGHEEDQPLTGVPAVGWVRSLRRDGADLYADVEQLFPSIAKLVERGAYTRVSPEIYPPDHLPEGVPARGHMMRRLSALGGELPHIKQLDPLPMPLRLSEVPPVLRARPTRLHALTRVRHADGRAWACFSEVSKMPDATDQIVTAAIKDRFPELPDKLIESLTPEQLKIIAEDMGGGEPPPEGGDVANLQEPPGAGGVVWPDNKTRQQIEEELAQMGEDPAALAAMTDEDLLALYEQKAGAAATPMSELDPPLDPLEEEEIVPDPTPVQPVKRQPAKVTVTQQFSEGRIKRLEARLKAAEARQAENDRLAARRAAEEQRKLVVSFCERLVKEGRVSAAEVEFGKKGEAIGPIAFALTTADAVRKFAEHGGKSALQVLMDKLEQRPVRRFAEQVPDPIQGTAGGPLAPERERQLLSYTRAGRRVLAERDKQEASHRAFAETLGAVVNQRLNGRA